MFDFIIDVVLSSETVIFNVVPLWFTQVVSETTFGFTRQIQYFMTQCLFYRDVTDV